MRYLKLAIGSILATSALIMVAFIGMGLWSYLSFCHMSDPVPSTSRDPGPYLAWKERYCGDGLRTLLLAGVVTLVLSLAAFFIVRYRGRRWFRPMRRLAESNGDTAPQNRPPTAATLGEP